MAITSGKQSFADFAGTLDFGQKTQKSVTSVTQEDEKRLLMPKVAVWGSASTTASSASSTYKSRLTSTSSEASSSEDSRIKRLTQSGLSFLKNGFSALRDTAESTASRAQDRALEAQASFDRYIYFTLSILLGCFLLFLSTLFLPLIALAPQKFALLFTLGSLSLVNGLGLLKGYKALFWHLIEKERLMFSTFYFGSIFITLYVTLALRSHFLTILFASLQLCSLGILLLSYLAGSFSSTIVKKLLGSAGSNILPI